MLFRQYLQYEFGSYRMMTVEISHIVGSRVRVQRVNDARLFSGWVDTAAGHLVHLALSQTDDLKVGDAIFCEAHTFSARVNFRASVERIQPMGDTSRFVVRLSSGITVAAGAENPRFRVPSMGLVVEPESGPVHGRILDISVTGIGANLDSGLDRGAKVSGQMKTIYGLVNAEFEVRYCRPLSDCDEFRAGLQIVSMDRESAATWVRYVRAVACGERTAA